jgi:hypothetical protein
MQLGAVITQGNRPIAFFSRKLSKAQSKYSVTKVELPAIVETLKKCFKECCGANNKKSIKTIRTSPKTL